MRRTRRLLAFSGFFAMYRSHSSSCGSKAAACSSMPRCSWTMPQRVYQPDWLWLSGCGRIQLSTSAAAFAALHASARHRASDMSSRFFDMPSVADLSTKSFLLRRSMAATRAARS